MTKIVSIIGAFVLCLITSGCFPYHYTMSPGLSGTVIDAKSQSPLAGAGISFGTNTTIFARSGSDGSFHISPERQWGIWIIPQDVFTRSCSVNICQVGYQPFSTVVEFNPGDLGKKATKQMGVISLIPASH